MKVSYQWLKKIVDFEFTPDELADQLTRLGLEVASVTPYGCIDGVIIAHVTSLKPHPNADTLKVCTLEGKNRTYNVVCGAPNVAVGQLVPLATEGCLLPSGITIKKSEIRGVTSEGMICSKKELGLGDDQSGIFVLERSAIQGDILKNYEGMNDWILEIELTPNRPDCLNIVGVAREIAVLSGKKVELPEIEIAEAKIKRGDSIPISVLDPDLCENYSAYIIRGVKVGPSPFWLTNMLEKLGFRSINNIVDVTNYVLIEMGHPLHAFDLNLLQGPEIIARRAKEGETIITIDQKERVLTDSMLVIADAHRPVAIAGIMGGFETEVTDKTTDILLEGAYFNPVSIRKTSKKIGLSSESSYRFERGTDRIGFQRALQRAASLIVKLGEAKSVSPLLENNAKAAKCVPIKCNIERINSYLGIVLSAEEIIDILTKLNISIKNRKNNDLELEPPSYRVDLSIEQDIVEEIARIYGYDRIPMANPGSDFVEYEINKNILFAQMTRSILTGNGFYDTLSCSLVQSRIPEEFPSFFSGSVSDAVRIQNPISEMQEVLQTSLIPNLINGISVNLREKLPRVKLFEIGNVFLTRRDYEEISIDEFLRREKELDKNPKSIPIHDRLQSYKKGEKVEEKLVLSIGVALTDEQFFWENSEEKYDFFTFKGFLEDYFECLGIGNVRYESVEVSYLHPGKTACVMLNGDKLGCFGQVHPAIARQKEISEQTYLAEFDADVLIKHMNLNAAYRPLPKYPAVERDLAIVIDKRIPFQTIYDTLMKSLPGLLEDFKIISLYEGAPIPAGKKSINFRMRYRSSERTLLDQEVDVIHNRLASILVERLQCELR